MDKYEETLSKYDFNLNDKEISCKANELAMLWEENNHPETLKFLYSCIDLTSLNTEDSKDSIWNFVKQVNDFDGSQSDIPNMAAVCVYPNFVETVKEALATDMKIAAVAGGFPSSQTFIEVKVAEVSLAIADGADEIDIVMNCGDFFENNLQEISEEIGEIKSVCRENVKLKVILETGLLKTAANIKKAALLSIYSGADFIKTSTGKVYPGATPEAVYVMCEAIKEYHQAHGRQIGIKVSGGIRTSEDALKYYSIVKEILGEEWLTPEYFRIGASSLAENVLKGLSL